MAIVDGEECPIEIRTNDSGDVEYTVGEQSGQAKFNVAQNGTAVLLAKETRQLALRIAQDRDHVRVMGRNGAIEFDLYPESRFLVAKMQGGLGTGTGTGTISASMPGRIVKVLVAQGDRVQQGQGILILEAMKMENEIKAPRDGVVSSITVSEGESVESGTAMAEISDD